LQFSGPAWFAAPGNPGQADKDMPEKQEEEQLEAKEKD
jgi:hypothetical protein